MTKRISTPAFLRLVADAIEKHPCVVIEAEMDEGRGDAVGSDHGAAARLRRLAGAGMEGTKPGRTVSLRAAEDI